LASCERAASKYDKEDIKVILLYFHGPSVFEPRSDCKSEVAAMYVSHEDRSPFAIHSRDTAPTASGVWIVDHLPCGFAQFKLGVDLLELLGLLLDTPSSLL
jgi:hypothetical protein